MCILGDRDGRFGPHLAVPINRTLKNEIKYCMNSTRTFYRLCHHAYFDISFNFLEKELLVLWGGNSKTNFEYGAGPKYTEEII